MTGTEQVDGYEVPVDPMDDLAVRGLPVDGLRVRGRPPLTSGTMKAPSLTHGWELGAFRHAPIIAIGVKTCQYLRRAVIDT